HLKKRGKFFFAVLVQFACSMVVWTMSIPVIKDFAPSTELMYSFLFPAQIILVVVLLISGWELTELTFSRIMRRKFLPFTPDTPSRFPKVSLHLPICNEPPHMIKITLDSLAALDYPNFEVLVIDNNTKDPAVWQPVKEYCEQLGERFRFFSLGKWPGFKAGALNFALKETARDAEIVGLIDADYVVDKDWLRSLIPYFEDPKTGWVQAPQDHREWENDLFKEMINWEYAGFFNIGMVTRNEANAIIQHGTMTLIRRSALHEVGDWGEWCICEDAELGLRLLATGYESVYVKHSFGHGLTPDTFLGYKKQRFRWAFGAMQIMKGHTRELNPFRKTGLTGAQKYHFLSGWLPWVADALYLLFTVASIFWSVGLVMAPRYFDFPMAIFVLPTVGVFIAKVAHHIFLYSTRIECTWRQRIGSAIAGMGLTFSIALAVWQGVFKKSTPFFRTPKCEDKAAIMKAILMAREETTLMLLQWIAAVMVLWYADPGDPDARLWALVLGVQSLPYAAALITSLISVLPQGALVGAPKVKPVVAAEVK
ncbi:MAG: glycosyltransferase, partial [Rhodospirillales bacterium]|nr:glycosyltransferase [Rhodospirillales bacterium]